MKKILLFLIVFLLGFGNIANADTISFSDSFYFSSTTVIDYEGYNYGSNPPTQIQQSTMVNLPSFDSNLGKLVDVEIRYYTSYNMYGRLEVRDNFTNPFDLIPYVDASGFVQTRMYVDLMDPNGPYNYLRREFREDYEGFGNYGMSDGTIGGSFSGILNTDYLSLDNFQPPEPPYGDIDIRLTRYLVAEVLGCGFDDDARMINSNNPWSGQVIIDYTYDPVPEPATMLLLGSGLVGLAGFRRKFRKK